jgi:hypothetical protein
MSEFKARIGCVRMKNGGADVRILNREPINPEGEDWRGKIVANARAVGEQATADAPLVGYVVIGLYADGCSSVGYRHDPDRCPIPRSLLPSWIAEIIRRDMIVALEARDVFNDMFERRDGGA